MLPRSVLIFVKYARFVGEETYSQGSSREYHIDDSPTWCVDPLDGMFNPPISIIQNINNRTGTVNYIHLFPTFCVSLAFIHNSRPLIGVIYAPFLSQLYTSCHGRGAFLNETQRLPFFRNPIPPMPPQAPKGCLFACEWGKDRRDTPDGNLTRKVESFVNMATEIGGRSGRGGMVHGVRSLGSAVLDLAYCATGAVDIWWEGGCWEWSVLCSSPLLRQVY